MASKTNTLKEPNKVNNINSNFSREPHRLCKIVIILCLGVSLTLLTVYTYYPNSIDNNNSVITNNTNNTNNTTTEDSNLEICLSLIIINWLWTGLFVYMVAN